MTMLRMGNFVGTIAGLSAVFGCSSNPPMLDDDGGSETSTSGSSTSTSEAGDGSSGEPPAVPTDKVDILFVIDNSASMGEEQAALTFAIDALLDGLVDDLAADYRIAVTTTDSGSPAGGCTSPENGSLVLTSCQGRLSDFVFTGATTTDRQTTCTDVCPESLAGLETVPTATDNDAELRARPWVEGTPGGVGNLPDGVAVGEALACFLPQGINGCGFESPLESLYEAVARIGNAGDGAYDFLRDDAVLAVVFLTDEEDCSLDPDYPSVFLPDGNKVFWSTPDGPTSAICWNAGVACSGAGPIYEDCQAQSHDIDGNEIPDSDAAVLHPVPRYVALLEDVRAAKSLQGRGVVVAALTGVPMGYENGADLVYQDVLSGTPMDPDYQINFGIGPGCQGPATEAVPPVRLRAFAEAFADGGRNLFSVCAEDYTPAIEAIIERIGDEMRP